MHKGDLITNITDPTVKNMQVLLEEQSDAYYNFINSLHSESTKQSYKSCLEKFLNHYRIHDKVFTSLRTAWAEELNLKKDITSYDDILDALRLSLKGYSIE